MRYLIMLGVVVLAVLLWRRLSRADSSSVEPEKQEKQASSMVQCRVCGVYFPSEEAVHTKEGLYCSDAHRKKDESRP